MADVDCVLLKSASRNFLQKCWRTSHVSTATRNHASVALPRTMADGRLGIHNQTTTANAARPTLPIAAPAASTPAAVRPLILPCSPACSFSCRSCFSRRVAVAGKMAGNAKNSPPIPGPQRFAIMPVRTVTRPPNRKRTAYSDHFERLSAAVSILIFTTLAQQPVPQTQSRAHPQQQR